MKKIFRNFFNVGDVVHILCKMIFQILKLNIEKYTGIKHAIGVGNATDAMQLIIKSWRDWYW
jgi:hypothetical protein